MQVEAEDSMDRNDILRPHKLVRQLEEPECGVRPRADNGAGTDAWRLGAISCSIRQQRGVMQRYGSGLFRHEHELLG